MALFKKKKKNDFVDLGERMRKQQEKQEELRQNLGVTNTVSSQRNDSDTPTQSEQTNSGGSFFSFFGNNNSTNTKTQETTPSQASTYTNLGQSDTEEKRRRLSKRLSAITDKLEELSNSIYKIEQRLELIERKMNLNRY